MTPGLVSSSFYRYPLLNKTKCIHLYHSFYIADDVALSIKSFNKLFNMLRRIVYTFSFIINLRLKKVN